MICVVLLLAVCVLLISCVGLRFTFCVVVVSDSGLVCLRWRSFAVAFAIGTCIWLFLCLCCFALGVLDFLA